MESRNIQNTSTDYSERAANPVNSINPIIANAPLSAVCWGAILAGAAASAALSLILLVLGTGLGLSSVSPWSNSGVSGTTFGLSTILWITLTSLAASAIGGYIAGRLRTRWISTAHADEIYFRDTAHGFLAWAIATLFTATLLTSVIASIVSGATQAGAAVAGGAVAAVSTTVAATANNESEKPEADDQSTAYFLDSLFRKTLSASDTSSPTVPPENNNAAKTEVARIYVNALANGNLPAQDVEYAAQVVAKTTGLSEAEAQKRVTDTYNIMQKKLADTEAAARSAADQARKVTAYGSLWLFISLLIGAFFASWAAITGGRQRDN